jgi:hypothetical protein
MTPDQPTAEAPAGSPPATGSALLAAASECEEAFMSGTSGMSVLSPEMQAAVSGAMRGSFRAGFFAAVKTLEAMAVAAAAEMPITTAGGLPPNSD